DTYGDKHSLFIRAIGNYEKVAGDRMAKIIDQAASAKDAVRQMLEFITGELLADREHKGCFLVNVAVEVAPHDQEVRDIVCQNDRLVEEFFYKAIKNGQESGEIRNKQDARALARFVFNNVKGIRVNAKSTTDKSFFNDIINLTMSVLD
ncbi:MAG: TetR/AcrR family transcriptional regulator, partial [Bacteroidetes bacterium]|nr:TetR/AcrR family transcriptional regulator [Bacteroidota bacterium]